MTDNAQIIAAQADGTAVSAIPATNSEDFLSRYREYYKFATTIATSNLIPESYKGKPDDCMIAVDMAARMGVPFLTVMQNLYVVKGKPSWSGQACKMLVENCGKFRAGSVRPVYFGEKDTDSRGCRLDAVWKDTGEKIEGPDVTIGTAKKEGWYNKPGSKWQTIPEQMLAYRAATFFARIYCPEALMGVQSADEVEHIQGTRNQS